MADNRFTAGNPIVLEVYTGGANSSGRYRISTGVGYATVLFEGTAWSFTGVATVDISDLFSSLRNAVGVMAAKMEAIDEAGDPIVETGDEYAFEFAVYGGGISDMLLRKLAEATTNIFDTKLKNNSGNFLLSTRTNARILYIPETELAPLKYYAQGLYVIVRAGNIDIATYDHTADASESVATIDLAALRLQHWTESGELVNSFEIKDALEAYCMTVVITEAMPATYKLKFRNSWGVDEYLAIEGDVDYTPSPDEVTTTMRHDTVVGKLVTYNDRKKYNAVFEAQLGMKDINGRFFVMDALMSDSVYLCVNNVEYACRLSADAQMLDSTRSEPLPVGVKIELLDKAAYAGNLLNMAALTGVFDEEFGEEFE